MLTPEGWLSGRIAVSDGRIAAIEPVGSWSEPLILPGFVDLHCHGGGGADIMDGGEAARSVARLHARHGTTAFLATTMTAPMAEIERAVADAAAEQRADDEARILGIHLEGPFISPDRLGAQPPFAIPGDAAIMERLCGLARIRVVTLAPEADDDGSLRRWLAGRGIRVQLGHSSCDYETAVAAFSDGVSGVTHLFNAMTGLHHRAPGIVGAALAHADFAELIPDLLHVHPGAIRAALRAIPRLYAVTDATAASGLSDGDYHLGRMSVRKCGNGVRLKDGTLAGSSLTMLQAFRNLVSLGLSIEDASYRTATVPADYLGEMDRGRVRRGAWADMVILDRRLDLVAVYVEGSRVTL